MDVYYSSAVRPASLYIAITLFDGVRSSPDNVKEMAALKVRIPADKPLARLRFDDDCSYPGWYVRYRLKGTLRRLALSTWDRNDVEGAVAEAAGLLRCPRERIQADRG